VYTSTPADVPDPLRFFEGLVPRLGVKEARGTKTTQVNARMATADRDTRGQAAHGQYKSRIVAS